MLPLILCIAASVSPSAALHLGAAANAHGFDAYRLKRYESSQHCAAVVGTSTSHADWTMPVELGFDYRKPMTAARAESLIVAWTVWL